MLDSCGVVGQRFRQCHNGYFAYDKSVDKSQPLQIELMV